MSGTFVDERMQGSHADLPYNVQCAGKETLLHVTSSACSGRSYLPSSRASTWNPAGRKALALTLREGSIVPERGHTSWPELARLTGVTVRTLHHYDEIGLCSPSRRSAQGYRLYDDSDVLRLQQVVVLRELGLPLDEIAAAIDGAPDRAALLRRH